MKIQQIIADEFQKLGLKRGDCLLIHSDLKYTITKPVKLHGTEQRITSQTFLSALLNVIGNDGTLVLPNFNLLRGPKIRRSTSLTHPFRNVCAF
jgi:aminoglycoside N3'-acetyltransferase